jgi:hypothetical protein
MRPRCITAQVDPGGQMATRTRTADGFGDPVNVQVLNTVGIDQVAWLSEDGCVVYGLSGPCCTYDLFMATRGSP